ncbi:hypothetical protein phiSA039_0207 [Staphylococcus phage phiSA039]|nr:hypothetical protein METROID_6 [Staphylococcus phage Metroid]QKE56286.1 hypothetical protein METROID_237 [Staphylococcus phage Metroid]BBC69666.1 hypothetical protein phiSA039_0207 [Staphylococcus phage phiSA039]
MFKVYYTVYHRGSMKTIKDKLDRSSLIYFLYEAKEKNISNISPDNYNLGWGAIEHVDINSLIEAVNAEGILLINRGNYVTIREW